MSRPHRIVIPGYPYHLTQRGNGGKVIFQDDDDRLAYLRILRNQAKKYSLSIVAYCLMTNHIHVIAVPNEDISISKGLGRTSHLYSMYFHKRHGDSGHLWNGRYFSVILDHDYFLQALHYVERNPVRAKICQFAQDYTWSSARAHISCEDDHDILDMEYWKNCSLNSNWANQLISESDYVISAALKKAYKSGSPLGDNEFVELIAEKLGYLPKRRAVGRPRKN